MSMLGGVRGGDREESPYSICELTAAAKREMLQVAAR
jgi:hypothetical protein